MAQLVNRDKKTPSRLLCIVRQRPHLLAVGLVVFALLALAIALGVSAAGKDGQTLIERSGSGGAESSAVEADAAAVGGSASGAAQSDSDAALVAANAIVVDVCGAVVNPGVYELVEGDRVSDAIEAAGGLTADADVSTLNRASKVSDGMKITVPQQGQSTSSGDALADGSGGSSSSSQTSAQASGLVNINTATADELQTLSGVGPSTAQAIVEDREKNGLFASAEDLMRVSGIGEKKFAKIKDSVCV